MNPKSEIHFAVNPKSEDRRLSSRPRSASPTRQVLLPEVRNKPKSEIRFIHVYEREKAEFEAAQLIADKASFTINPKSEITFTVNPKSEG